MLISYLSAHCASLNTPERPRNTKPQHAPGGRSSRSHTMHQVAGREYRLFRAWALRPGNERGCVEPPELERSPQLVTAGRNVRRWCLTTAVRPAIAHAIPCHPEHREGSPPISSHPHSIPPPSPLHLATIQPLSRHHPSSSPPTPILSPPYPFFAAPRFHISLILNNFQLRLGENAPKQNHNSLINNHLQKRPSSP